MARVSGRSRQGYIPLFPTTTTTSRFRKTINFTFLLVCVIPLGFLTLSIITYLTTSFSRPCLPFSLQRISSSGHRLLSCSAIAGQDGYRWSTVGAGAGASSGIGIESESDEEMTEGIAESGVMELGAGATSDQGLSNGASSGFRAGRLADFLQSQKESFLQDLRRNNLKGWTISMGNEAGDLDSLASSVAFAYLSQTLRADRSIPLLLTPSSLMRLRPENLLALHNSFIPPNTLLHLDAIPEPSKLAELGARFALVDHNRLLPTFVSQNSAQEDPVVAIIDHHDDEQQHLSAAIREITVPTGSCASLVVKHFQSPWTKANSSPAGPAGSPVPPELATLLLSSILIDTAGLKAGGKATRNDTDAASFLYPLSTLTGPTPASFDTSSVAPQSSQISALTNQLQEAKFNVSDMSTHDLLLRDYKEYTLPTLSAFASLQVGLSTVPLGLKAWLDRDGGWASLLGGVDECMKAKNLDVEGVLTTYNNKDGKHRRELLLIARTGRALHDLDVVRKVVHELEEGLERDQVVQLEPWSKKAGSVGSVIDLDSTERIGRVWKQGNTKATRKQVAPLMRDLVAGLA